MNKFFPGIELLLLGTSSYHMGNASTVCFGPGNIICWFLWMSLSISFLQVVLGQIRDKIP